MPPLLAVHTRVNNAAHHRRYERCASDGICTKQEGYLGYPQHVGLGQAQLPVCAAYASVWTRDVKSLETMHVQPE